MGIYKEVRYFAGKTSNTLRMRGIFIGISNLTNALCCVQRFMNSSLFRLETIKFKK